MQDKDLVNSFVESQGKDLKSYNLILKKYESVVFRASLRYLRNKELAEEITQEVFLKVYSKLDNLQNPDQLKSWILRITSNACSDRYSKLQKRHELKEKVKFELQGQKNIEQRDDACSSDVDKMNIAIERLKTKDKEILIMHYYTDLKISEIADQLDMSESAVKMRLHRSREKVLKLIKEVL